MPIKVKLNRLTVPQAETDEGSQLFVLNKSNPKGNINFVVSNPAGGRTVGIQVPITFIPVDLSLYARKADVLDEPNFRRLVGKGFIHIIESKSAEEFLQDPSAKKEYDRINEVLNDSDEGDFQVPVDESVNAEPPKAEDTVSQFVQNILLRETSESVATLIVELEGKFDTMTDEDVVYLSENSTKAELKAWCVEAAEAMADPELSSAQ